MSFYDILNRLAKKESSLQLQKTMNLRNKFTAVENHEPKNQVYSCRKPLT